MMWRLCSFKLVLLLSLCAAVVASDLVGNGDEIELSFLAEEPEFSLVNFPEQAPQQKHHNWMRGGISDEKSASDSCFGHSDCFNCTKESRCHWCEKDQKCHVIGSVFGCVSGMTCDDEKKKKQTDACAAHSTCLECSANRLCHWCAHDDSCHAIGSMYGCVSGVNCYSNDRCRRTKAEPLPPSDVRFTNMGFMPLLVVGVVGMFAFCCATFCLCCACGVKGAYDDLCSAAASNIGVGPREAEPLLQHDGLDRNNNDNTAATTTSLLTSVDIPTEINNETADVMAKSNANNTEEQNTSPATTTNDHTHLEEGTECFYQAIDEEQGERSPEENYPLIPTSSTAITANNDDEMDDAPSIRTHTSSKHAKWMMNVCTLFYCISVLFIGGIVFGSIRLFPKIPDYSVCNDSVAWTKLMESMATFKPEVDFELLMSISNENHFGVNLDAGRGIFKHDGTVIGNYTIPPVEVSPMSISDVMVIATLKPDKWEAMALTKEYYEDKLVLHVDAELNLRAPNFLNFSKAVNITDRAVEINREADRHLCACKAWDGNNSSPGGLLDLFGFPL